MVRTCQLKSILDISIRRLIRRRAIILHLHRASSNLNHPFSFLPSLRPHPQSLKFRNPNSHCPFVAAVSLTQARNPALRLRPRRVIANMAEGKRVRALESHERDLRLPNPPPHRRVLDAQSPLRPALPTRPAHLRWSNGWRGRA